MPIALRVITATQSTLAGRSVWELTRLLVVPSGATMQRIAIIVSLALIGALVSAPRADAQDVRRALRDAVTNLNYEPVWPPSTEPRIGSVYIKVRNSSGRQTDAWLCDIFPENAVPSRPSQERWDDIESERRTDIGFFVSLLRAIGVVRAGEAHVGWRRVSSYELDWGSISSERIEMLALQEVGQYQYTGAVNRRCVDAVGRLLRQNRDAYIVGQVARSSSLTARVRLNPSEDGGGRQGGNPTDGASHVASGGEAAQNGQADEPAQGERAAQGLETGGERTAEAGQSAAAQNQNRECSQGGQNQSGVHADVCATIGELVSVGVRVNVASSGEASLTFDSPYAVGRQLYSLRQLRRSGNYSAPILTINIDGAVGQNPVGATELSDPEGAIDESRLRALRASAAQ